MTKEPSPAGVDDEVAFMGELRRLKAWSGLSFREIERRATEAGDVLPYSTASTMLGKDRLPRKELLIAFVNACGADTEEWAAARVRLTEPAFVRRPRGLGLRTPRRRRPMIIAAAALAAVLATGTGIIVTQDHRTVDQQITTP